VFFGLLVIILGIWKWRAHPTAITTPTPMDNRLDQRNQPAIPGTPQLIEGKTGTFAIPLYRHNQFSNIAIYNRQTKERHLLFTTPVSIRNIHVSRTRGNSGMVIVMASEDTNSNGTIDATDIHQLYWYNGTSGEIRKINRPLLNFLGWVSSSALETIVNGDVVSSTELLYKVSVDTDHNGRADAKDPIQYVLVNLSNYSVDELLPESVVPTAAVKEDADPN
jgi:hypothetical protein